MKNYDKLWKNWQQKTILSELNKDNRKKLLKYVEKTMTNLGSDSLDILTRTPFNYAFGDKLRIVIPLEENVALKLTEQVALLKLTANQFYEKKHKEGSINDYLVSFNVAEETVQQSIEGGRETKEVKIRTPQIVVRYLNKMNQLKTETFPLGRAFNKFKMDEAARYWSQVQSGLVTNEQLSRQLEHFVSMTPVTTPEHIAASIRFMGGSTESYSIVVTRSPIDVARMSDFSNITSCHSQKGSYFICALEEAKRGGAVAYVVKNEDVKKLEEEGRLQDSEIFFDEEHLKEISKNQRSNDPNAPMSFDDDEEEQTQTSIDKIVPVSRIRIRRVIDLEKQMEYMVPEESEYGTQIYKFRKVLEQWCADKQSFMFAGADGKPNLDFSEKLLFLTGGSYQDTQIEALFRSLLTNVSKVLGIDESEVKTANIDWEGVEDPLEDATDCERNTNIYSARAYHVRLNSNFSMIETLPQCNENDIFTGYRVKLRSNFELRSLNVVEEKKSELRINEDQLQKINNVLSTYTQLFGELNIRINGTTGLSLIFTKLLTTIDDFNVYDQNCILQTHQQMAILLRKVLTEMGISRPSPLLSQKIYNLLAETEENQKFSVEFDPETDYRFIYNTDTQPEALNMRYRNWFMGPLTSMKSLRPTSQLSMNLGAKAIEKEGDPLVKFPEEASKLINLNPQSFKTIMNTALGLTYRDLNSILRKRGGTSTMFDEFTLGQANVPLEVYLDRSITIGNGGHLSFDAFLTDNNKGINLIIQGSCLSSNTETGTLQFATLVNWISNNTELIEDTFYKHLLEQINQDKKEIANVLQTNPRRESETEMEQHQQDAKFGGSKEEIVREILSRVVSNYGDRLIEIPEYVVENKEPAIKFYPSAFGILGQSIIYFRYGVFTEENTVAVSAVTNLNKVFFTKVIKDVNFPLTAEQTAAFFDGFVEEIRKKVLGPYYYILEDEKPQVKESKVINKKLLREKLIRWYRRNKNEQ
jgi:hypothetical protein